MANVSQVRSLVDSVIGGQLGTYSLPDGSTSPALWVRGSQQVPKDWTVNGIGCVIDEVPEVQNRPTLSKAVFLTQLWSLNLTSYDTTKTLDNVRTLLLRALPDITNTVHSPQTDIAFETLKVTIPDYLILQEQD